MMLGGNLEMTTRLVNATAHAVAVVSAHALHSAWHTVSTSASELLRRVPWARHRPQQRTCRQVNREGGINEAEYQ